MTPVRIQGDPDQWQSGLDARMSRGIPGLERLVYNSVRPVEVRVTEAVEAERWDAVVEGWFASRADAEAARAGRGRTGGRSHHTRRLPRRDRARRRKERRRADGLYVRRGCSRLNSLLASGDGPVGSGVDEMQRAAAAEKFYKMTPEKQEWLLARMSDVPMRGLVSPVTTGGASIDKPVDYLGVLGDVMEPQHEMARSLGGNVSTVDGDVDHAFIVAAPEKVLGYLRLRV